MIPSHGVAPQTSTPPYTIDVTNLNNGYYRVKLTATKDYFEGFLLRAKEYGAESTSSSTTVYSGTFMEVPDLAILDCGPLKVR